MNLTIAKEKLIDGLQSVQNVVSTRTTLPILSNVLMKAEDGKVEFTATDLGREHLLHRRGQCKKEGRDHHSRKALFWRGARTGQP